MTYKQNKEDYRIKYQDTIVGLMRGEAEGSPLTPMRVKDFQDEADGKIRVILKEYKKVGPGNESYSVDDPRIQWRSPELGMVESLPGTSSSFISRKDKKQYRLGLLTDNLKVVRISQGEEKLLGLRKLSSHPLGVAMGDSQISFEEMFSLFNRKFYERGECLSLVSSGKSLSLPLNKDFAIVQKRYSSSPLLNKRGIDIGRVIPSGNKVVLKRPLSQYREQIEALGFSVEIK